jgi:enoyl-CoA hydratase
MVTERRSDARVRWEPTGGIGWLVLARPERHNAIDPAMMAAISDTLASAAEDPGIKVVVLRGEGPSFSAGFDVSSDGDAVAGAVGNDSVAEHARLRRNLEQLFQVWDFPKPVIAAVHGYCLAGASMLASLCDITVVTRDAKIGVSSLPLGGGYITPLWMHLIGPKRAKQMAFQPGETIRGDTAAEWGWANYAVAPDDLLDDVAALATRIARTPVSLLRMKKHAINRLCELQGFRAQALLGAEMDALLHFSDDVAAVWKTVHDVGIKQATSDFRGGSPGLSE